MAVGTQTAAVENEIAHLRAVRARPREMAVGTQTAAVENEIAHLRGLDLQALRARWRSLTGRAAPAHLSKALLLRVLAYRVQAAAFGDLDKATARLLDRIADEARLGKPVDVPVPDR